MQRISSLHSHSWRDGGGRAHRGFWVAEDGEAGQASGNAASRRGWLLPQLGSLLHPDTFIPTTVHITVAQQDPVILLRGGL